MEQKKFRVMQSADSNSKVDIWYVNDVTTSEINEAVYAVFCEVAQKVLDRSTCFVSGDRTAAELAGTLGSRWVKALIMLDDDRKTMAPEVSIKVGGNTYDRKGVLFECHFRTDRVFEEMAEWEGVMNLPPSKYHRFACECKQESFSREKLKPYQRCHGYKPRQISLAAENARINNKFEVIGPMGEVLGSEGMKRALSVLTAVKSIEKLHGYDMGDLADQLLRRKLWREYGTYEPLRSRMEWMKSEAARMKRDGEDKSDRAKKMSEEYRDIQKKLMLTPQPMCYTTKDFEHGPEVWKQVDEVYVKELVAYFRQVLAESPAPAWPKKGDMVMLKKQETRPKKWQGKLGVYRVCGQLDMYHDKINWYAEVHTTKGKHDATLYNVEQLEPVADEPKKPTKKAKAIKAAKKQAAKASAPNKSEVVREQSASCSGTTAEPTPAERLRAVLLAQVKQAA